MSGEKKTLTPVVRRVLLLGGVFVCVAPLVAVGTMLVGGHAASLAVVLFIIVVWPVLGWIVLISFGSGIKSPETLEKEVDETASFHLQGLSAGAITYHFQHVKESAALIIDPSSEQVHFVNCFTPSWFLARQREWHTSGYADLRAVYYYGLHVEGNVSVPLSYQQRDIVHLVVITSDGKAHAYGRDSDDAYATVIKKLLEICPTPSDVRLQDHPLLMPVVMCGIVLSIFIGAAANANAADDQFAVGGMLGGVLGAVVSLLGVWGVDRLLRRGRLVPKTPPTETPS